MKTSQLRVCLLNIFYYLAELMFHGIGLVWDVVVSENWLTFFGYFYRFSIVNYQRQFLPQQISFCQGVLVTY